jgi:hypothetical protein
MDEYAFRAGIALIAVVLCGFSWIAARSRLYAWHRLPLDYTIGLFTLTYGIGCVILFVFQADYIVRYYGTSSLVPARVSYALILLVGAIPYIVVPWTVVILANLDTQRARTPTPVMRGTPVRPEALFFSLAITLIASFAVIAPVAPMLVSNALSELSTITSAASLYSQRQEVFESVNFLQGGVIYSILPPVAAILLFWPGKRPWMARAVGGLVGVSAIVFNIGLFQIGPTLAFILTCVFCYAVLQHGRPNPLAIGLGLVVGIVVLGLYSFLKSSSSELGQIELFVMRMPIPLPFLIQMSGETAVPGTQGLSLAYELGEYMFPQLRAAHSFVAMPQPGFVDAWFTFNIFAGIAVLVFVGFLIAVFGRLFAAHGFGQQDQRDGRLILWAVVAAPTLYYAFQVDIINLIISSYSITFCTLPTLAVLSVNALLPHGENESAPAGMRR